MIIAILLGAIFGAAATLMIATYFEFFTVKDFRRVKNVNRKRNADEFYNYVKFGSTEMLFTDEQIRVAVERFNNNKEDVA